MLVSKQIVKARSGLWYRSKDGFNGYHLTAYIHRDCIELENEKGLTKAVYYPKVNCLSIRDKFKNPILKALVGFYYGKEVDIIASVYDMVYDNSSLDCNNQEFVIGGKSLTVKGFGKYTKASRLKTWSIIAERLKSTLLKEVKYFTSYEDLRHYFTLDACSGSSCMRGDFDELPVHPCIVYAHDAEDHYPNAKMYVDSGVKLAVLFEASGAVARCIVDTSRRTRGKAQGEKASELTKLLSFDSEEGICGSRINIVPHNNTFIMPYIDENRSVDEKDGEIGCGDIVCNNTEGVSVVGVYSEWHDEHIPEDEAVYSEVMEDYIYEHVAVSLFEGGYCHPECEVVHYSEHEREYFVDTDDWYYLEFKDDWVRESDVIEVCFMQIEGNVSLNDLVDFANEV